VAAKREPYLRFGVRDGDLREKLEVASAHDRLKQAPPGKGREADDARLPLAFHLQGADISEAIGCAAPVPPRIKSSRDVNLVQSTCGS
jgi:hypothetical protein